jgi:acyl-CoA synthetase (AMP-forming)/AMP-acid ligase II
MSKMTQNRLATFNLGDILQLPAHAERAAIVDLRDAERPATLSSLELDAVCTGIGRGLLRRGIRPGARIGILAENRVEYVAGYFGIMRMGGVAVPVNHKLPRATIAHIFGDSGIELAFGDAERLALVPDAVPRIDFDDDGSDGWRAFLDPGSLEPFLPDQDALAEILYTSGSTGVPKGVPLTHAGQLWAIAHYIEPIPPVLPEHSTIIVAPLYHMNALFNICVALANRMRVILLPRFGARSFLETVARYRCSFLSGVPTMYALMVRERDLIERLDLSCVREVSLGSAPLTDALLGRVQQLFPNAQVENGFGTTEAGPAVFGPHPDNLPRPPLALGYPLADIDCKLVDGASADAGVLALRTPALMPGYLNQPQATASRMRDGWYLTGDVMRRDANGFFYFLGRADDMFNCGGENVYPGEIEKMLERHEAVAQAIVVPAPDDIKGQIPIAFIVPRRGAAPTADQIKQYALLHGPAFAHPRFIEFLDNLPVAGTQKIDRTSLTAEAARIARAAGRSSAS